MPLRQSVLDTNYKHLKNDTNEREICVWRWGLNVQKQWFTYLYFCKQINDPFLCLPACLSVCLLSVAYFCFKLVLNMSVFFKFSNVDWTQQHYTSRQWEWCGYIVSGLEKLPRSKFCYFHVLINLLWNWTSGSTGGVQLPVTFKKNACNTYLEKHTTQLVMEISLTDSKNSHNFEVNGKSWWKILNSYKESCLSLEYFFFFMWLITYLDISSQNAS